jgi:hypothetical protein
MVQQRQRRHLSSDELSCVGKLEGGSTHVSRAWTRLPRVWYSRETTWQTTSNNRRPIFCRAKSVQTLRSDLLNANGTNDYTQTSKKRLYDINLRARTPCTQEHRR